MVIIYYIADVFLHISCTTKAKYKRKGKWPKRARETILHTKRLYEAVSAPEES